MSIYRAMYSGISGLAAEGQVLGVIGDNVANVNTVGFKQSRAQFEDVLGGAIGASIGAGVRMARTQQIFSAGALLTTGQQTDLALTGDGFFVVNGTLNGTTGDFFTRNGQLTRAEDGRLVNGQGLALQGYQANDDGSFSARVGDVTMPTGMLPAAWSETIDVVGNLNAGDDIAGLPWDPNAPVSDASDLANSNFNTSTSVTVYDSLGTAHTVDIYYQKTATNEWDYHAVVDGGDVSGGSPGVAEEIASGTLTFNPSGQLVTQTLTGGGSVDFLGAEAGQALAFNFGTSLSDGGNGTNGIQQNGSASTFTKSEADGYAAGELTGFTVSDSGVVMGKYSNGEDRAIAKVAVAKFSSNEGLDRAGNGLWVATRESGQAVLGEANSGGRGAISAGTLEGSNVDIAQQFVDMITHQRAFSANSKTITTADEMLQELVNLKR